MKLLLNIMIIASILAAQTAKAADEVEKRGTAQPARKDRLSVTVKLSKAAFAADEAPKFTVQYKNVSDQPFSLYDVAWFWSWNIRFEDPARKGPWQLRLLAKLQREKPAINTVKPGETVDVIVDLNTPAGWFDFTWQGEQGEPIEPLKQLTPGKYQLTVETELKEGPVRQDVAFWTGHLKTEAVEFEVTENEKNPADAASAADKKEKAKSVVAPKPGDPAGPNPDPAAGGSNRVHLAAFAQPSKLATERANKLKADVKTFSLRLAYNGEQDKPYYHLSLRVPGTEQASQFHLAAQISEEQATAIIDQLALDGFLDNAIQGPFKQPVIPPKGPHYAMTVQLNNPSKLIFEERLAWDIKMLQHFDGLRKVLKDDAAKNMDFLLGRMAGHRKQWEQ